MSNDRSWGTKLLLFIFVSLLLVLVAAYVMSLPKEKNTTQKSEVVLEKIQAVQKLVSAEGYFTDVYSYEDYKYWDLSYFRKKALIKVKARASYGFDLKEMQLDIDPIRSVITISQIPEPELLSLDPDYEYYDMTEGFFNEFSTQEKTQVIRNARSFIEQKAEQSDLKNAAYAQGRHFMELIEVIAREGGYTVEYQGVPERLIPAYVDSLEVIID